MWYFARSALLAVALLLLTPYFLLRREGRQKYLHSLGQRLGSLPKAVHQPARGAIWIHAVSVGEALAVAPLLASLRRRFPARKLLVSTTTRTGQEIAAQRLGADATFYFPLDFAFACRRALRAVKPALIVLVETELWPRFLRESHQARIPAVLVNGRISDRSFRHYRFWRHFLREMPNHVTCFLMQTEQDSARIRALGAAPERVTVVGNLKFDFPRPTGPAFLSELERTAHGQPILVAGSTLAGEETILVEAVAGLREHYNLRTLLVLAPRHPERFREVAAWLNSRGVAFLRRSAGFGTDRRPEVVLLDTLGELAGTYAAATVAFVGGSLVPAGGHNPIEPALWGKPVVFGPHMNNFRAVAQALVEAKAAFEVRSREELMILLAALLSDRKALARVGAAALELVGRERGATERSAEAIAALLREEGEPARAVSL